MSEPTYGGSSQLTVDALLKRPKLQGSRARKTLLGFVTLHAKRKSRKRAGGEMISVTDAAAPQIELAQIG